MNEPNELATAIEIEEIERPWECAELARVLADVWRLPDRTGVASPDILRALAFSGGYVVGVRVNGRLVGGGLGWPTRVHAEWRLHSHVIGFVDGFRAMGFGAATKRHQRQWARRNGLAAVEWTFDPLRMANAHFNLVTLGAEVAGFHRDFYGDIDDAFNAGLGSDRFLLRWGVDEAAVPRVEVAAVEDYSAVLAIDLDGSPVVVESLARCVRVAIPSDIVAMRTAEPAKAAAWRDAFAATVGGLLIEGATVTAFTASGEYLIVRRSVLTGE